MDHITGTSSSALVEVSEDEEAFGNNNPHQHSLNDSDQPKVPQSPARDYGDENPSGGSESGGEDVRPGQDSLGPPSHYRDGMHRLMRGFSTKGQKVTQIAHPVLHRMRGVGNSGDSDTFGALVEVPVEHQPANLVSEARMTQGELLFHGDDDLESGSILDGPTRSHSDAGSSSGGKETRRLHAEPDEGALGQSFRYTGGMRRPTRGFNIRGQTVRQIAHPSLRHGQAAGQGGRGGSLGALDAGSEEETATDHISGAWVDDSGRLLDYMNELKSTSLPKNHTSHHCEAEPTTGRRWTPGLNGDAGHDALGRSILHTDEMQRPARGFSLRNQSVRQIAYPVLLRGRGTGQGGRGLGSHDNLRTLVEATPEDEGSLDTSELWSSFPQSLPSEIQGNAPANDDDTGAISNRHLLRVEEQRPGGEASLRSLHGSLDNDTYRFSTLSSTSSSWFHSVARVEHATDRSGRDFLELGNSSLSYRHLGDEEKGLGRWGNWYGSEEHPSPRAGTRGRGAGGGSSSQESHGMDDGGRSRAGGDNTSFALSTARKILRTMMAGPAATARPWPQPQPPALAAWDDSIESQSSPLLTEGNGQDLNSTVRVHFSSGTVLAPITSVTPVDMGWKTVGRSS